MRVLVGVGGLLVMALGASAQQPPVLGSGRAPKQFWFDGGFRGTGGLEFTFTRAVPTVDNKGMPVPAGTPRYSPPVAIASAPAYSTIRQTSAGVWMIASGLDHDGVTPLLVVTEARPSSTLLDVFVGGGEAMRIAEKTGLGRNRTTLGPTGDVMRGAVSGKGYRLSSGVVCHGLIVLFCTVMTFEGTPPGWRDAANAFVVSQDQGRTWSLVYESAPFSPGWQRGAPWSMQNWWPMKRWVPPTEAYFAASDYCHNPNSPGGRFYLIRATRGAQGEAWVLNEGIVALTVSAQAGEHVHSGGVVPFGERGLRAFVAVGDARRRNRIVSLVNPDGNYVWGNWDVQQDYHGARGTPGIDANQFIGCAPGPTAESALVGGDLAAEQVMRLWFDQAAPSHPHTDRVFGLTPSDGTGNNVFVIRTPTPELGGPYCANAEPFSLLPVPQLRRALYSEDGVHWVQAASPDGGYAVIHAGDLYFDGDPGQGIVRTRVPRVRTGRPLLVGPGGWQHTRADAEVEAGVSPRLTALTRNASGMWEDGGVALDPQPPCMGPVYKVTTTSADELPGVARIYPGGQANRLASIPGFQTQVRAWLCHKDPTRTAVLQLGIGDSVTSPQLYRTWYVSAMDTWIPAVALDYVELAPGATLQLYLRAEGDVCPDQTVYVALDAVQEGSGIPGYPMPPDTSVPPVGSARPDELARVRGLACGMAWTITLAVQIPEDGFDFRSRLQARWPLATLWGDASNHVEIYADTDRRVLGARLTSNGRAAQTLVSRPITFVRGAPILVSLAQPLGTAPIEMTVSAAGQGVHTVFQEYSAVSRLVVPPREIRFHAASSVASSTGIASHVSPLLIWGGRVDEGTFVPRGVREASLKDLSFLDAPGP